MEKSFEYSSRKKRIKKQTVAKILDFDNIDNESREEIEKRERKKKRKEIRKRIHELSKIEGNRTCADCGIKGAPWCSVNLGIFICLECAGGHYFLGTHISKVKNIHLDFFYPREIESVKAKGNKKSNLFYEHNIPKNFTRDFTIDDRKLFVKRKYSEKIWAKKE